MSLCYRAAYAPTSIDIVERNHRTIKVIATRKQCSIPEAVHLYNVTLHDGKTMAEPPAIAVYSYEVKDCVQQAQEQHSRDTVLSADRGKEYSMD